MDNEQLVARIRAGEDVADNMLALWQNNRGMVGKLAREYGYGAEREDLEQEGYIALCDAAGHYDASAGVPFINYAVYWIRQRMRRYVENCGGVVRIPAHMADSVRKYKRAVREYVAVVGRKPTERETCAILGVSVEKLERIEKAAQIGQIRSLEEPIQSLDGDVSLSDTVPSGEDLETDAIRRLDAAAMGRELWEVVERLPGEQQRVVRARYVDGETLKAIGEREGLTVSQVKDKHDKALWGILYSRSGQTFRRYFEQYLAAAPIHHVGVESFKRTWTSEVERAVIG